VSFDVLRSDCRAYRVADFAIYSPPNETLLPNEAVFINIETTIGSGGHTPPTPNIRRLGPLRRTQVDDKVLWYTTASAEMLVPKTTNVICLLIHRNHSSMNSQCICMSPVVDRKKSNQYSTLGPFETVVEGILLLSSSGNTCEQTLTYKSFHRLIVLKLLIAKGRNIIYSIGASAYQRET
jgi:hypothetical protein